MLKLNIDLNKKKQKQILFIYIVKNKLSYLIEKLASTTNININNKKQVRKSIRENNIDKKLF